MLKTALKVLQQIEASGFQAYIVGGFVRDKLLGIESHDIDICTSATPKDIRMIFKEACLPHEYYGSVTLVCKSVRFEITTFRRELIYFNNRKPIEIEYISDLKEDLLRRDFTINALIMNANEEIIDLLHGQEDIEKKEIRTIGNSQNKFSEDSLRILRAIRFATNLNFTLNYECKEAILKTKELLKTLSYERKKEELERIFLSPNVSYGVSLLVELGLDIILEIPKLKTVPKFDDLIGVWAYLDVDNIYPFSKIERDLIQNVRKVMLLNNLDPYVLYEYKLYINSVAGNLKGISKKDITRNYNSLPIYARKEIKITSKEICEILNKKEGPFLREIWKDLEMCILYRKLANNNQKIKEYIIETYL